MVGHMESDELVLEANHEHCRVSVRNVLGRGLKDKGKAGPQVYRVDQEPHGVVGAHFHAVDQFQLVSSGSGRIGAHPTAPFTLHYTDAYSPYGPIVAAEHGMSYFTIRAHHDTGARPMPKARAQRHRRSPRAQLLIEIDPVASETSVLHEPEPDGLGALRVYLSPGEGWTADAPMHGGGWVGLVLDGQFRDVDGEHGAQSGLFLPPGESHAVEAGVDGLDLLIMQFPTPTAELTWPDPT